MNFKKAYTAANEEIHGDKSILTGINQKPKKIIYFNPVSSTVVAAVLCLVSVFLYPYIAPDKETPSDTENVFLTSEQTPGLTPAFDGETQPSAPSAYGKRSINAPYDTATEEAAFDEVSASADATYEVSEDLSSVTVTTADEVIVLKVTKSTRIINQNGDPCTAEVLRNSQILNVQSRDDTALEIMVRSVE